MFVWFWIVFLVVLIIFIFIFGLSSYFNSSNICNMQFEINNQVFKLLKEKNFNISKTFYIDGYGTYNKSNDYKKMVVLDNENKEVCFVNYEYGTLVKVNFNEILNYEIYENGSSVTTGGNIGGFFGGIFAAETNGMVKELKLIIRLKRYDMSQVTYDLISKTTFNIGINKSNEIYKNCISSLQEVVSFLEVVKNENSTNSRDKFFVSTFCFYII